MTQRFNPDDPQPRPSLETGEEAVGEQPPSVPPRPPQVGDLINPFSQPFTQPLATYVLLAAIILIFGLTMLNGLLVDPSSTLFRFGATFGPSIIIEGQWWRFLTAMFLHADITHILFNGYALYILGLDMERIYGRGRYLALYFLTGLFGGLASFWVRGMDEFSVGASGAIFGILGMNLAFFAFYRNKLGKFGKDRLNRTLQLVGINLVIGFLIVRVNNLAHMGGLVSGFLLGYLLVPQYVVSHVIGTQVKVYDRSGLTYRWWVILLASAILLAGFFGAFVIWR